MSAEKVTIRGAVKVELEKIQDADADGLLKAESVVEFAKDEESALHSRFEWDDSVAAHQQRLSVARSLIRSYVAIVSKQKPERYRAYVSLTPDRTRKNGGYRSMASVMGDEELRAQLLADASGEMRRFMAKYSRLQELAEVFAAMESALAKAGQKEAV